MAFNVGFIKQLYTLISEDTKVKTLISVKALISFVTQVLLTE